MSFLSLVEKLNNEFNTDLTDVVDSLQELTVYGSLLSHARVLIAVKTKPVINKTRINAKANSRGSFA